MVAPTRRASAPRWPALAVALGYAGGVERAGRAGREPGEATALLLVAALAGGRRARERRVRVRRRGRPPAVRDACSGSRRADLALSAAAAALLAAAASLALGRAWSAIAFDPDAAPALGLPAARADLLLLALVAVAAVAAIPAVGALLVAAVFVLPGAAARLVARTIPALLAWSVALALAEGVLGLYLAYWLDLPPGPPVAVLGALTYGVLALAPGAATGSVRA